MYPNSICMLACTVKMNSNSFFENMVQVLKWQTSYHVVVYAFHCSSKDFPMLRSFLVNIGIRNFCWGNVTMIIHFMYMCLIWNSARRNCSEVPLDEWWYVVEILTKLKQFQSQNQSITYENHIDILPFKTIISWNVLSTVSVARIPQPLFYSHGQLIKPHEKMFLSDPGGWCSTCPISIKSITWMMLCWCPH